MVRFILKDNENRIWLGTEGGLFLIDETTGKYTMLLDNPDDPESISDRSIVEIYKDSKGDIWVGTFNGLNKMISVENNQIKFKVFRHDATQPETSISSNRALVLEESDGVMYVGTSSGLCGYDYEKKIFTNYSKDEFKNRIQSIEKTVDGNLWISTSEGILFFDTQTKMFNKYGKLDGLSDIVFQTCSSHKDKDGCFYFGSRRGVTRFHPQNFMVNEMAPPVYVTEIKKISPEGEQFLSGTHEKEVVLDYNEYYLSIDFAALNFNRSAKNQYAFKLEGFEENWNYSNKKVPAVYTNLHHGEYNFRVKAANNDGVWNESGVLLKVIKKPAYWETWWFDFCLLYTSPSPRDQRGSRMPSSA